MIEVLAGNGFDNAVCFLGLDAVQTYKSNLESPFYDDYEVWEVSDTDFQMLCDMPEEDWKDSWGWWRHSTGSTMHTPNEFYEINNYRIIAWDGYNREHFSEHYCAGCEDRLHGTCGAEQEDVDYCCGSRKYENLLKYFEYELGLTAIRNVCALATDLAKYNNIKLSTLFKWTIG